MFTEVLLVLVMERFLFKYLPVYLSTEIVYFYHTCLKQKTKKLFAVQILSLRTIRYVPFKIKATLGTFYPTWQLFSYILYLGLTNLAIHK